MRTQKPFSGLNNSLWTAAGSSLSVATNPLFPTFVHLVDYCVTKLVNNPGCTHTRQSRDQTIHSRPSWSNSQSMHALNPLSLQAATQTVEVRIREQTIVLGRWGLLKRRTQPYVSMDLLRPTPLPLRMLQVFHIFLHPFCVHKSHLERLWKCWEAGRKERWNEKKTFSFPFSSSMSLSYWDSKRCFSSGKTC